MVYILYVFFFLSFMVYILYVLVEHSPQNLPVGMHGL